MEEDEGQQGQEFVIGGYTSAGGSFDALIFGYYDNGKLLFAARTRNGLAQAGARWSVRICRVDERQSSATFKLHCVAR